VAGGNRGRQGAPLQHRQPLVQPPIPDSTNLKTSTKLGATSTSSRSSIDTRPKNQLNAAKEQHKDLCNILQGASVTLHIILLGVGGTIYNTHTLKPFKELGLDSQRVKKLLRLGLFLSVLQTHSQLVLLRAWANFSDCGFSRRVFLFRQEFSFSQSYRFFPSFCQALAEDRVTTPTKKINLPPSSMCTL